MFMYKPFSIQVMDTFLTEDRKGEYTTLVIDEVFMENTANKFGIKTEELIVQLRNEIKSKYCDKNIDFKFALAVISLQLYAASKCEADEEFSANAYNPRLCEILNCSVSYLQSWYRKKQNILWKEFYKWCRENNYQVQECLPRDYKNKYIQYPLKLARYLLNREDLKYIASIFKKYRLEPNEDIFYSDFWKVLDVRLDFWRLNNHIQNVFDAVYEDTNSYDIVKSQIYNYYLNLTWNGEYIDPAEQRMRRINLNDSYNLHLSDKYGNYRIDVRKEDDSRVASFQIDLMSSIELKSYYSFKREEIIIFQRGSNDDLNYWNETRFIEDKDSIGIAVVFNNFKCTKFCGASVLSQSRDIIVYEFKYNNYTSEFYSDGEKSYTLLGGLRVAHNTYLTGGDPIWRIHEDCEYLINGKNYSISKGDHILDLAEGEHIIKFPKSRGIKIAIIAPRERIIEWDDNQFKWEVDRKQSLWGPKGIEAGIIGLDYGCYSKTSYPESPLQTWAKLNQGENIKSINNIALKLLNNINKYV